MRTPLQQIQLLLLLTPILVYICLAGASRDDSA